MHRKTHIVCIVYSKQGYMDLVSEAAERSMRAAIDEVESLPHYQDEGEVMKCVHIHLQPVPPSSTNSGLLLMQGMTPLPMPTTQQCLACLESNFEYPYSCMYI